LLDFLDKAKRFLWMFVELAFLLVLAIVLIYLLLGQASGSYVLSVVENVTGFAAGVQTTSLIGFAIILALIYLVRQRLK
jgi:hypothetical protein